jgi:hypothetical protein
MMGFGVTALAVAANRKMVSTESRATQVPRHVYRFDWFVFVPIMNPPVKMGFQLGGGFRLPRLFELTLPPQTPVPINFRDGSGGIRERSL